MSSGKKIKEYFKVKPRARQSEDEGEQAGSETVPGDESQNEANSSEPSTTAMPPCECLCCTDYTTPHQPMNLEASAILSHQARRVCEVSYTDNSE